MSVVLTILKIIGILLLAILVLFLAVLLLVLFVPVRYRADGAYENGRLTARGSVTWLLHLVSIKAGYDGKPEYSVKVAGITFLPKKKEKRRKKKAEHNAPAGEQEAIAPKETAEASGQKAAGTKQPQDDGKQADAGAQASGDAKAAADSNDGRAGRTGQPITGAQPDEDARDADAFTGGGQSAKKPDFSGLKEKMEAFAAKFSGGKEKISGILEKISYYKGILTQESSKRALRHAKDRIFGVIRAVLPRKMDVRLVIGTGDPASVGQILAIQGMLYPVLYDKIHIIPDFEEKRAEGTFSFRGHIRGITFVMCALRLLLDKDLRQLVKRLLKKEES